MTEVMRTSHPTRDEGRFFGLCPQNDRGDEDIAPYKGTKEDSSGYALRMTEVMRTSHPTRERRKILRAMPSE